MKHTPMIATTKAMTTRALSMFSSALSARSMTRAEKLAQMAVTSSTRYSGPMIRAVARNSCFISFLSI